MNATAGGLTQAVLGYVVVTAALTGVALGFAAPRFLLIAPATAQSAANSGLAIGSVALVFICLTTWVVLRRLRFTLRAIGLGSRTVEPDDLRALDRAPGQITITALGIAVLAVVIAIVPPLRVQGMDLESAVGLGLLAVTLCATAALALYILIRRRVARTIALAPEDATREMIQRVRAVERPDLRIVQRVVMAVLTPTAMVAFGIAILAHAHVRAFEARGRLATAMAIAQAALEPVPGAVPTAGEGDAVDAADEDGFETQLWVDQATFGITRESTGIVRVTVPLDYGHAVLSFDETTLPALAVSSLIAGLVASLLAAALAAFVGRMLVTDLVQATRQVQLLGTEAVLRGSTRVARPARFAVVVNLGVAIEALAARFRVFASAQEKAIEAREAARRMRGLLFASVSHDFKGSLNTILGFADLIDHRTLVPSQRESLEVIRHRGRELLSLVQSILDGARVEAGQLVLDRKTVRLADVVGEAVESVIRSAPPSPVVIINDVDADAPWLVQADFGRLCDAFCALLRHSLRTSTQGRIAVRGAAAPSGKEALIDVEAPTRAVPAATLSRLLLPDGDSTMPRSAGGLAIGLSLARSLVVLHQGNVRAFDVEGGVVLRVSLPLVERARSG